MSIEFLKANYLDTTTSISILSGTDTTQYLFNRDVRFQYVTSGYTGATVPTIRINFAETMQVSRIALMEHNFKSFLVYYNGATASTFNLSTGADTTVSDYSTNSETSHFLRANSVFCTSVSIDIRSTISGTSERAIGFLAITDLLLRMSRPPASKGYTPKVDPKQVVHTLSDGGTRVQNISQKMNMQIAYEYLERSERDSLKSLWDLHTEMLFCPFGTSTGWDEVLFPCVWVDDFEFYKFSQNAASGGFSGKIKLLETPN